LLSTNARPKVDFNFGFGRRTQDQIAERTIRAGGDSVEAGDLNVGRRPTDAVSKSCRSLGDRKALAADLSGNVADPGKHQFLAWHP